MTRTLRTAGLVAILAAMASTARPDTGAAPDQFGGNWFVKILPGSDFVGLSYASTYMHAGGGYLTAATGSGFWRALDLEPGIEVAQVCVFAYDDSPTAEIYIQWAIYYMSGTAPSGSLAVDFNGTGIAAVPGYTVLCIGPGTTAPYRIRAIEDVDGDGSLDYNWHRLSITSPVDANLRWAGGFVRWRRSIAPAPATATYPNDVPTTSPIFRFVEALSAAGITAGCGPGSYCPDAPVTRGQMAVFLTAALGLYWPQ